VPSVEVIPRNSKRPVLDPMLWERRRGDQPACMHGDAHVTDQCNLASSPAFAAGHSEARMEKTTLSRNVPSART